MILDNIEQDLIGFVFQDILTVYGIQEMTIFWTGEGDSGYVTEYQYVPEDKKLPSSLEELVGHKALSYFHFAGLETDAGGTFTVTLADNKVTAVKVYREDSNDEWDMDEYAGNLTSSSDNPAFNALLVQLKLDKISKVEITWIGRGDEGSLDIFIYKNGCEESELVANKDVLAFIEKYSGIPDISPDGDGGTWEAVIDVQKKSLTFSYAVDYGIDESEPETEVLPIRENYVSGSCKQCNQIKTEQHCCPEHVLVGIEKIIQGFIPFDIALINEEYAVIWKRREEVEDEVISFHDKLRAHTLDTVLAVCEQMRMGIPSFLIQELDQLMSWDNIQPVDQQLAIVRLAMHTYPYFGKINA
jgi:hypothetical protein